jgi:hypothetical protein
MFRLFRFVFKAIVLIKLMTLAFSAGMGLAYLVQLRQQYRSWGLLDGSDERGLRGDDLVAEPQLIETRAIDIDATPEKVWPWLAQLGYGRGGWYSFPALDRPWTPGGGGPRQASADEILPEFQDLAEGDLVPTASAAGFAAKIVEPGDALVLYLDDEMVREQVGELMADVSDGVEERGGNLALDADFDMPPYQVSWAFELQELAGGRTRLVERLRARIEATDAQWRAKPLLGMGVFALMRGQLEGIKRRVEAAEDA